TFIQLFLSHTFSAIQLRQIWGSFPTSRRQRTRGSAPPINCSSSCRPKCPSLLMIFPSSVGLLRGKGSDGSRCFRLPKPWLRQSMSGLRGLTQAVAINRRYGKQKNGTAGSMRNASSSCSIGDSLLSLHRWQRGKSSDEGATADLLLSA